MANLTYWADLFKKYRYDALCLDIETTGMRGEIALVGLYKPKEGEIIHTYFLKDVNLTKENLRQALKNCKLLITYNGLNMDIRLIKKEFPGVIPENVKVLDLYLFARQLGINTNLKALEHTFGIERLNRFTERRGIAVKMWKRYIAKNDQTALKTLIEYNKQDAINLYFIAEELIKILEERKDNASKSLSKLPRIK